MNAPPTTQAEISLIDLGRAVWADRRVVAALVLGALLVAMAFAFLTPALYRSEALVQPRQESRSAANPLLAQLQGVAELTGGVLAGGGDRAVAIATLRSRRLIEAFISERNLLAKMYPKAEAVTVWEAYNDFTRRILKIAEDRKTGLVTVAIEWTDPIEAQQWVTELIARTNAHLRNEAVQAGEQNLEYLQQQARRIGQVELQQSLYTLVETEMKKLMLAQGNEEFALRTIDAAVVPKKRFRPRRALILAIGAVVGLFAGITVALARRSIRN